MRYVSFINSNGTIDNDLREFFPLGFYPVNCCPCPEHRRRVTDSATLTSLPYGLMLWSNACKSNAFTGTISAGEAIYIEGLYKSQSVGDKHLVWQYTDGEGSHTFTNTFTVLSQRIFGDLDFDGDVDSEDKALHPTLSSEYGWVIPVNTNAFRIAQLRTDIGLSGTYTLSLEGDPSFCVWQRPNPATNETPMLVAGQIVTNGIGGVFWNTGSTSHVYLQAVEPGTATLVYSFYGTSEAEGIVSRASMKLTAVNINLGLMWETANEINQIFNPTRKDDSTGNLAVMEIVGDASYAAPRNYLYVVGDHADGKFRISLDVGVEPAEFRGQIVCAAYDENNRIEGSDAQVPNDRESAVEMSIPAPGGKQTVLYGIRAGLDVNGNGLLDPYEPSVPLEVYVGETDDSPRYAMLKGISKEKYDSHYNDIYGFVHFLGQTTPTLIAPNARSFLALFLYNGDVARIAPGMYPSSSNGVPFNAFSEGEGFAEWLTHNSGATFDDSGLAEIAHFYWDDESCVSQFMANRTPFALKSYMVTGHYIELPTETGIKLKDFYDNYVKDVAETALADATNNAAMVFPQGGGWYGMPCEGATNLFASLSPQTSPDWVVPSTQLVGKSDDYNGWHALAINFLTGTPTFDDFDAFATVGRGRVIDPKYRFNIQKRHSWPEGTKYVVAEVEFSCDIEDLYDFNYEDGEKSAAAAALQLGFGRGAGISQERKERGKIYRHTIQIRKTYRTPFIYYSY
jgi:hypothetical protein